MPVPTNRNKILPARGNYSDLDSNKASLLDGEICYAIDQDQYYQKEGSVLVAVGATKAQGTKADTAVQPGANISVFTNNAGYLTNASLEISNAQDVNITSIEEDQVLLWDGSDFVNGSAPVMVEVKNSTGSTISKGSAVYVSGTHTSGKPLISLADNDGSNTCPAIGLVHKDIANGDEGYVTVSGVLFNINTSFSGWSAGDALYLSDTPGALTNTRPTITAQKVQKVALVTRVHATAGSVIVIGAGRTNDIPNDLVTLTGVSLGDTTLGTFTGTTISDNESIKDALQTLETAVENAAAPSNVLTTTTTFSGDVSGTYNNISITDGPGSGLDADTVDGLQATSFLRSDASDIFNCNGNNLIFDFDNTGRSSLQFTLNGTAQWNITHTNTGADINFDRVSGSGQVTIENQKVWYAGNDGAGTGLDADTLDGVEGSNFLRSDADDTFTGTITGATLLSGGGEIASSTAKLQVNGFMRTGNIIIHEGGATPTSNNKTISNISGELHFDGEKVWTANNDGSGSGLDADTLDGVSSASFLRSDAADTTNNDLTISKNGTPTFTVRTSAESGQDAKIKIGGARTSCNTCNISMLEFTNEVATPYTMAQISAMDPSSNSDNENGKLVFRTSNNGTLEDRLVIPATTGDPSYNGNKLFHAGNDGAGSGLDADTLDGLAGASYLRSNANDEATGQITLSGGLSTNGEDVYTSNGTFIANDSDGAFSDRSGSNIDHIWHSDGTNTWHFCSDTTYKANGNSTVRAGSFSAAGNTVWHAGNDGAGSGLDADTLDGLSSTDFLKADGSVDATEIDFGDCTIKADDHRAGLLAVFNDTGDWSGYQIRNGNWEYAFMGNSAGTVGIYNDNNNEWIIKAVGNQGVELRYNGTIGFEVTGTDSAELGGNTVWHAGNDGAGSGLDADTVDGLASTSFLRSDADDTTTGNITIERANPNLLLEGTGTTSGNYPTLRFNTGNNQGIMIEHNEFDGELPIAGYGLIVTGDDDNTQFPGTGTLSFSVLGNIYAGATSVSNLSRVLTTADEGAFNGLDADMVDGIDASGFLRSNAYDQYDGQTSGRRIRFRCVDDQNAGSSTGNLFPLEVYQDSNGTNSDAAMAFHIANGFATYFGLNRATNDLFVGGWSNTTNKYRIWHAGNDGAGSGLDADTLDGLAGASFLRSNATDSFNCNGFALLFDFDDAGRNSIGFTKDGTTRWQFTHTTGGDDFNFDRVSGSGQVTIENSKVWYAGNDGAGSLLDADTLDGVQAGGFLRSNEFDAKTSGGLRFSDNVELQLGNNADCELYHNGANTYITNNTGVLFLQSDGGTQIKDSGGNEIHLKTVDNAQVELYYNNSKKLNTTAAGVEINSSIEIINSSTPFIDFKNNASDDFDSRILANPNALKFYTGGNGSTAEHFQIAANGNLTATDTTIGSNSDIRLKTNVSDFTYSLEDFKQYQPKTFDWRNPQLHGNKTGQRGFIAQDVEAIDDYWVDEQEIDEDSADAQFLDEDLLVKTLKLGKKDAMYVSVIQQALAKIEALETTVSNLQARVTQLEAT